LESGVTALAIAWLVACRPDGDGELSRVGGADDSRGADTGGPPGVDPDWGVVVSCEAPDRGGFDEFYDDGTAVLVYGTHEAELASRIAAWYGDWVDLDARAADELTDADRQENLLIVGSRSSNALLAELNGSLPVWFEDDAFVFGGQRYDEHGHGIALVHPSPFAKGRWITLYAGNSSDGAYSTFTVPTGGHDFATTRGGWTLLQEGELCRDGSLWGWYGPYVTTDAWPTWSGWIDSLDETATEHYRFRYPPGTLAAASIGAGSDVQENRYATALDALRVEALDEPITTYLYPDNETKGEVTGDPGNGHANAMNYETHVVFGEDVNAFGIHEDIHVIAWHRIGDTPYALLGEGLAVSVEGTWSGHALSYWASAWKNADALPSLAELEADFRGIDDSVSYPVAGHFVAWLTTTYGIDVVKALYVAPDLDAAFESELGLTHDEVETAWRASIP
jgi:hypothetical protein